MRIRLLFAAPDKESHELLESLLASTLELTPIDVAPAHVTTIAELLERTERHVDDVILLDWPMAQAETPALVEELLARNPQLRIVALLPSRYRQYRQEVWRAGACSSIAKENMEQEWLASILCIMHRSIVREAELHAFYAEAAAAATLPTGRTEPSTCCTG